MTPSNSRNRPGSISIGNVTQTGSIFAVGENISATNTVGEQSPVAGEAELAALRAELSELITSGRARAEQSDTRSIAIAIDQVDDLDDELHTEQPRPALVAEMLAKLVTASAGVASVSESVERVVHVLGTAFGLR